MKQTILSAILIFITGSLSSVSSASLLHDSQASLPIIQLAQNNNSNLNNIVKSIKQKTGGRILSARTVTRNGKTVYKIKVLLPSGKIQTFTVPAQ